MPPPPRALPPDRTIGTGRPTVAAIRPAFQPLVPQGTLLRVNAIEPYDPPATGKFLTTYTIDDHDRFNRAADRGTGIAPDAGCAP